MKRHLYLVIPFVLLIGLMFGGLGPRREVRELREQLRTARELLNSSADTRTDVSRMTQLLGVRPVMRSTQQSTRSTPPATRATTTALETNRTNTPVAALPTEPRESAHHEEADAREERMQRNIDQAMELWKLRSDIARSTFAANAALSEEDAANFDVLMGAMNLRLENLITTWAEAAKRKERLDSEDGIRLMNGVTDVLVLTYDEMDHKLPADWRMTGGKGLRLMDFVDPSVAKPLVDVGNKLDGMGHSFKEADDHLLDGQ